MAKHKALTLGILGAANIARQFTTAVQGCDAVRVTAVASRNQANADAFAKALHIPRAYASYEALLADPSIEAVYIPLPNHMHAQWSIKALQAGKHVLCEKPLCLNADQARAMFATAKKHGVMLLEAYPYWFQPQTRDMLTLLSSGAIGQVRFMQVSFGFTVAPHPDNIRLNPHMGGGALLDAGAYPISLIRLVMGQAPVCVQAQSQWTDSGVDISTMATLEYADGRRVQMLCAMNVANMRRATIAGTAGTIETEYLNHTNIPGVASQLRIRRGVANSIPFEEITSATGNGFRFEAEAFADVVRRRDFSAIERASVASIDIAHTLETIAQSAKTGRVVQL